MIDPLSSTNSLDGPHSMRLVNKNTNKTSRSKRSTIKEKYIETLVVGILVKELT